MEYVQEMIKSAFTILNNPQSASACGCGSSFALKNFASNPASHWTKLNQIMKMHM